ncbi:MAG: hypothetical protein WA919_01605 [Coleofasciculaceae cyanobacterium]
MENELVERLFTTFLRRDELLHQMTMLMVVGELCETPPLQYLG